MNHNSFAFAILKLHKPFFYHICHIVEAGVFPVGGALVYK